MLTRINSPETRATIKNEVVAILYDGGGDEKRIYLTQQLESGHGGQESGGADPGSRHGTHRKTHGVVFDIIGVAAHTLFITAEDVDRIMRHPATAIGSDGPQVARALPIPGSMARLTGPRTLCPRTRRHFAGRSRRNEQSVCPEQFRSRTHYRRLCRCGNLRCRRNHRPRELRQPHQCDRDEVCAGQWRAGVEDESIPVAGPAILYGPGYNAR